MLKNAGHLFKVRPALLFTVLLGFTKDPYPYVRAASLEGLVGLSERGDFNDVSMVKGCYQRALQLLTDMEDCVRLSAVRVVRSSLSLFWIQSLTFSSILFFSVDNFHLFMCS
jgi:integrator complex subunit 4